MSTIARAARAYWNLNERAWNSLRPLFPLMLAAAGAASVALWAVGLATGNIPLLWAPVCVSASWLVGTLAARVL